jgi:hypothetical protein
MPMYLFLATVPCDVLSAFLVLCGHVVYPGYLFKGHLSGMAALQDQKYTGAMVWVNGAESAIFGFLSPNAGAPDADGTA